MPSRTEYPDAPFLGIKGGEKGRVVVVHDLLSLALCSRIVRDNKVVTNDQVVVSRGQCCTCAYSHKGRFWGVRRSSVDGESRGSPEGGICGVVAKDLSEFRVRFEVTFDTSDEVLALGRRSCGQEDSYVGIFDDLEDATCDCSVGRFCRSTPSQKHTLFASVLPSHKLTVKGLWFVAKNELSQNLYIVLDKDFISNQIVELFSDLNVVFCSGVSWSSVFGDHVVELSHCMSFRFGGARSVLNVFIDPRLNRISEVVFRPTLPRS